MTNQQMTATLNKYQQMTADHPIRRKFFRIFRKKMLYRSTKSENPEATMGMVKQVLHKLSSQS